MMSVTKAIKSFLAKFPKLTVVRCVDYDNEHYVIEAVKDVNAVDYNDPFYAVDKRNGEVTLFVPGLDLDAFFEAVENRTLYLTYEDQGGVE